MAGLVAGDVVPPREPTGAGAGEPTPDPPPALTVAPPFPALPTAGAGPPGAGGAPGVVPGAVLDPAPGAAVPAPPGADVAAR